MKNDASPDNVRDLLSNIQIHLERLHAPACNLLDDERLASWNAMVRAIAAQPDSAEKRGMLRTLDHLLEKLCPRPLNPRPSLRDMIEANNYIDHLTNVLDDVMRKHDIARRQHEHLAQVNAQLTQQVAGLTWEKGECERRFAELERTHAQTATKDRERGQRRIDTLRKSLEDAERAHATCQLETADVRREARQVTARNRRLTADVDALHRRVETAERTWAERRDASDLAHEQAVEALRRDLQEAIIRRQECDKTRELEQSECDAKIARLSRELRDQVGETSLSPAVSIVSTTSEYARDRDLTQDDIDGLTDENRDWCLNSKAVSRHSKAPDGLTLDDLTCECYAHHRVPCKNVADSTYKARCVSTQGSQACTTNTNFEGDPTWDGEKLRHFKMARQSKTKQKLPTSNAAQPTPTPTERSSVRRSGRVLSTRA